MTFCYTSTPSKSFAASGSGERICCLSKALRNKVKTSTRLIGSYSERYSFYDRSRWTLHKDIKITL